MIKIIKDNFIRLDRRGKLKNYYTGNKDKLFNYKLYNIN